MHGSVIADGLARLRFGGLCLGAEGKSNGLSALARRHKNEIITERNSQLNARRKARPVRRIGRTTLNSNVTPHCYTVGASATSERA